ncbi:MAG: hypothetical protein L0228_00910 [Planctomycetes bacterium]|nr:hypothetical protein [Planctomycetota bacterium]
MPRFVLLYHECPPGYERPSHWDFMLEAGDTLRTWALLQLPRGWEAARARTAMAHPSCAMVAGENKIVAERLADHRLDYLHEEGPLSGNRGEVRRIDAGTYVSIAEKPESWEVELSAGLVRGTVLFAGTDLTFQPRL